MVCRSALDLDYRRLPLRMLLPHAVADTAAIRQPGLAVCGRLQSSLAAI